MKISFAQPVSSLQIPFRVVVPLQQEEDPATIIEALFFCPHISLPLSLPPWIAQSFGWFWSHSLSPNNRERKVPKFSFFLLYPSLCQSMLLPFPRSRPHPSCKAVNTQKEQEAHAQQATSGGCVLACRDCHAPDCDLHIPVTFFVFSRSLRRILLFTKVQWAWSVRWSSIVRASYSAKKKSESKVERENKRKPRETQKTRPVGV